MQSKKISHSILMLSFWMIASLGIMQHTKAYFSPEIAEYFGGKVWMFDIDILFAWFVCGFLASMIGSAILVRFVKHRRVLYGGLIISIIFVILSSVFVAVSNFFFVLISMIGVGVGCGMLPISSLCCVMRWLRLRVDATGQQMFYVVTQPADKTAITDEENLVYDIETRTPRGQRRQPLLNPIGVYLIAPLLTGTIVLVRHFAGVAGGLIVLFGILCVALYRNKDFGEFVSKPSLRLIGKTITSNYMFYFLLLLFTIISCVDVVSIYYLPTMLRAHMEAETAQEFISTAMLLLFIVRMIMVLFTELSLVRVPVRRLVLFSHLSIAIGMFVLVFVSEHLNAIILLFTISSSLSVMFPTFIKGFARNVAFSMLPFCVLWMSLIGTIIMFVTQAYIYPLIERTKSFSIFYLVAACTFVALSVSFFIIAYRRSFIRR